MDDWAIVIGVDHYPASANWTLRGAVRDALSMRAWLLSPRGAGIAPKNLTLLLGPDPAAPAPAVDFIPATLDNIVSGINTLLARSNKKGDRLFFHYSGHGLSLTSDLSMKQGILASDFSALTSHKSLTVMSLFELFQSTSFRQQFFVIDACRNIPVGRIRLADFPYVPEPVVPAFPQFVMFATQPGVEALEVGVPGDESGAFTSALLSGLNGQGAAKAWDDDSREYVVRWNELFSAVLEDVRSRKLRVDAAGGGPIIQEPRQYGERGNENPELARFAEASVPEEELLIDVAPSPTVLAVASVSINTLSGVAKSVGAPIDKLPIVARLRPRTYGVNGVAVGYKAPNTKSVRLYAPTRVTLEFHPDAPGAPGLVAGAPQPPAPPAPAAVGNTRLKGGLEVTAQESVALLQVANEAGTILGTDRGRISLRDLPPGFYSLRLISPEGVVISEVIESPKPGGSRRVELSAPPVASPAMEQLTELAGFQTAPDGSVSPSETVGPTFFLKTSTVLALAAAAQLEPESPYGQKLRRVPLPGFHQLVGTDAPSGLHIVLGDERNEGFWQSANVLDITRGETTEMREQSRESRLLRSVAVGGEVGRRIVRVEWVGHSAVIPCYVLPGRVTLLVMTREMDGSVEVHQYMPLSGVRVAPVPGYSPSSSKDPFFGGSAFAAIRRIEYMQRTFAHGRMSPLKPDVELLLYDKWVDPIAGCLGCYLAFRLQMTEGREVATRNLVQFFGELPDAHVLRGAHLLEAGQSEQAQAEFQKAMDIGIPIFREGAMLLAEKVKSMPFEESLKKAVMAASLGLAGGQPWSMVLDEPIPRESTPENRDQALRTALTFLKQRGVKDPDVDFWLAFIDRDTSAMEAALKAGADVNITDAKLLRRYVDLLRESGAP